MLRELHSYLEQQLVAIISAPTSETIQIVLDKIEERAKESDITVPVSYKLFGYGYQKLKESNYEESLELLSKSLSLINKSNQSLRYYIEYAMGIVFIRLNQLSDAISSLPKVLNVNGTTVNSELVFRTYNNLSIVFLLSDDYTKSHSYLTSAYELITDETVLNNSPLLSNYAYVNGLLGRYEEAEALYDDMEKELEKNPSTIGEFFLHNSYGSYLDIREKPELALGNFKRAIELSIELKDYFYQLDALKEYCTCAVKYGLDDKVAQYVNDALLLIKDYGTPSSISYFADTLMYLSDKNEAKEQQVILMKQAYELQGRALELHSNNNQGSITELYRLHSERPELENAKALEQNLELVTSFGEYLNSHSSLNEIVFKLYDDLKQVMPLECLSVGLYNRHTKQLHYDHFIDLGVPLESFVIDCNNEETLSTYCIETKKAFIHGDFHPKILNELLGRHTEKAFVGTTDEAYSSIIMLPLILGEEVIGIFAVQTFTLHAYQEYQFSLMKQLGSYLAIDIQNKQQQKQLVDQQKELNYLINIDPLTGLLNRKSLVASINQWKSLQKTLTLTLIDIDFYKQYNDLYGHVQDDEILLSLSELLKNHFNQKTDKVFRYGGDEFLILNYGEDKTRIIERFKRLQHDLQQNNITHEESSCSDVITLSIGGHQFTPDERVELSVNELIQRADDSLYHVKNKGRNEIFIGSD